MSFTAATVPALPALAQVPCYDYGYYTPEAVADRGYYSSEEILTCDKAGITVTLPKPITSGIEAKGRFGKQDFVYLSDEDVYPPSQGRRRQVPAAIDPVARRQRRAKR